MTGGQDSAGTGRLEQICAGLGVDPAHIRVVVPLPRTREEMKAMLREEIAYDGVSVIIPAANAYRPPNGTTQPNRNNSDTPVAATTRRQNPKNRQTMKRDIILSGVGDKASSRSPPSSAGLPSTRGCTSSRPKSTA